VPGGITGPPCSWEIQIRGPGPPGWGTDRKENYVLRKIQRGLDSMAGWCKHWNIKINEDTRVTYFTSRNRQPDSLLTLNGRNTPFVNNVYLHFIMYNVNILLLSVSSAESGAHPTSCPIGTGCTFPMVKLPELEAEHSPAAIAWAKITWIETSNPTYVLMA
jgi:hypothetical protein